MNADLNTLKNYIEKDIEYKSTDFFSNLAIEKVFIPTELKDDTNDDYSYEKIFNILVNNIVDKFVILGNGGQGKTHFLKKIYIDLYNKNKLPIYVSLQDYSNWEKSNNKDIIEYITYKTGFDITRIETKIISKFNCVKSNYYLLLDGLDEYNGNISNFLNNQIFQGRLNCNIVITSRNTHSIYFRNFKALYLKEITEEQIKKYLLYFYEKQQAEILFSKIKQRDDIYNLAKIPLFLALLCNTYKNNPNNIDNIHSKSDFIMQVFDDICNNKIIKKDERLDLLNEYYEIAFKLKNSQQITPSKNAKKLQLLIPSNNSYQFIHKLFEDYFCAMYISANKTSSFFLEPSKNNFKIFDKNWKQTIIFWFGINNISQKEKLKLFNALYKFKDKTSGWYSKRNHLFCCEILGEFHDCPIHTQKKLLNLLLKESEYYYNLTDEKENQRNNNKSKSFVEAPYVLNLATTIFTTNRNLFCKLIYDKLQYAWQKQDKKAPFTTYIARLADLQYNSNEFRNLLLEIYKKKYAHFASDLYAKAFKICAYDDNEIILFFIDRLENPLSCNFDKESGWIVSTGMIDILKEIVPDGSFYVDRLSNLIYNSTILNQYGANKNIIINSLASFLKKKITNQDILLKIKEDFPNKNAVADLINEYLNNHNQEVLLSISNSLKQPFVPPLMELRPMLKEFDINKQKEFLKTILLNEHFIILQKSAMCILADNIYDEKLYLENLFNEVKNNENHILYQNLLCLSYVIAMCSADNDTIKQAIDLLKAEVAHNPNNNEVIHWLGGILQQQKSYKNGILEFLKQVEPTEYKAILEKTFYTTLEDENKIEFKKAYMRAILDKNNKKDRDNLLYNLYLNSKDCNNNDEIIDFSIQLVKTLPLKNNLHRKFILIVSSICVKSIFTLNALNNKLNNKFLKQIICNLGNNTFLKIENKINNKYFNYPFQYLDKVLINLLQPKDYEKALKQLKKENYTPVLSFLAYEMPYLDYYKIYHPVKYNIVKYGKAFVKYFQSIFTWLIKFYSDYKDIINSLFVLLFAIFCITIFLKEHDKSLSFSNYVKTFIQKQIKDYE